MGGFFSSSEFGFSGSIPSSTQREECLRFLSLIFKQTPQARTFEYGTVGRLYYPPIKDYVESFDCAGPTAVAEPETFVGFRGAKTDGQFRSVDLVFDVSRGGSLCEFVPPEEMTEALHVDPRIGKSNYRWAPSARERFPKAIALARLGGCARDDTDYAALPALIVILKYRFMPQLIVSGGYHFFLQIDEAAKAGGLIERFAHADGGALCDLFHVFRAGIKGGGDHARSPEPRNPFLWVD